MRFDGHALPIGTLAHFGLTPAPPQARGTGSARHFGLGSGWALDEGHRNSGDVRHAVPFRSPWRTFLLASAGKRERFGEEVGRLRVGGRAQREALLAALAFLGCNLRDEADLANVPVLNEADGALALHLVTVAHAQAAQ